ncbi:hypothetical protein MB02_14295 [Croceicoccus estronivorus]|uniref:hypothetical protein n=1 Tax=Croceicoccus estronivorus TaxID=1172626 RepID=UPI00082F3100|nr:hypothetical protein [Croceicoccus estronivorus]OCC22933.1 hypothetical protein MB02_14295 [Croceicoccus estronivorus]
MTAIAAPASDTARRVNDLMPDVSSSQPDGPSFAFFLDLESSQLSSLPDQDIAHAAAITPAIGQDAQAFVASPLLVATAVPQTAGGELPLERRDPAPLRSVKAFPSPPATAAPPAADAGSLPLFEEAPLEAPLTSTPTVRLALQYPAAPALTGQEKVAGMLSGSPPASTPIHHSATPQFLPLAQSRPNLQGEAHAVDQPGGAASAKSSPISSRAAPASPGGEFTVHWLPVEGGIRLFIRLPRMSDDMRGEMELRLRELFEQFGLTLRDLDLHQTPA